MKRVTTSVLACSAALLIACGSAHAQCDAGWRQGPNETVPGVSDVVTCSVLWDSDGNGPLPARLVIGGTFIASQTGTPLFNIAMWDGTQWVSLAGGTNGRVDALTTLNNDLIAGGTFTVAGGQTVANVASWNGTTWSGLGAGLTGQPSGSRSVRSLTTYNGELYAGGEFTTSGVTLTRRIARFDGTNWQGLGSGITAGPLTPTVNALAVFDGQLYAGGNFAGAGGVTSQHIARWNGTTWSTPAATTVSDTVNVLRTYNNELWIGGSFLSAGGQTTRRIARYNGTSFLQAAPSF